jgi:hypothetical protein
MTDLKIATAVMAVAGIVVTFYRPLVCAPPTMVGMARVAPSPQFRRSCTSFSTTFKCGCHDRHHLRLNPRGRQVER